MQSPSSKLPSNNLPSSNQGLSNQGLGNQGLGNLSSDDAGAAVSTAAQPVFDEPVFDEPVFDEPVFDEGGMLTDRPAAVACPACRHELVIGEICSCKFAGCPQCGGMLFQQDVFAMLIQHMRATSRSTPILPQPINLDELKVRRTCPACQNAFETHAYGGPGNAVIDSCFPCQLIWCDLGEFSKLVRAPGRR